MTLLGNKFLHKLHLLELYRYEEAREEEKMRSQREDFSDMVAEVG